MTSPNQLLPPDPADVYRYRKLFSGNTGLAIQTLRADVDFCAVEDAFAQRADRMNQGTFDPNSETHRDYAPTLAAVMGDSASRRDFMTSLDTDVFESSTRLKTEARTNRGLDYDVTIVGGGTHAAILAARLRHEAPNAKIAILDRNSKIGGHWRSYGDRPVFYGNSRNHRRQNNGVPGLPGGLGNLNSLGRYAPFQLTDFGNATNFTNLDMGDATAIVEYLSADVFTDTEYLDSQSGPLGSRFLELGDREGGGNFRLDTGLLVFATGAGERRKLGNGADNASNIVTVEELLSLFGDRTNQFPMDQFVGKRIGVGGAGDSGKIAWELLTWLAPQEAYGRSTIQLGGPGSGFWWGCNFENREEYCDITRSRYRELGNFIVRDLNDTDSLIVPFRDKATSILPISRRELLINQGRTSEARGNIFVNALPLEQTLFNRLGIDQATLSPVLGRLATTRENTAVARVEIGTSNYFVGPVASPSLTQIERDSFDPRAGGENVVSIWAAGERTDSFGGVIGPLILRGLARQ
jgi:hypothetical protein